MRVWWLLPLLGACGQETSSPLRSQSLRAAAGEVAVSVAPLWSVVDASAAQTFLSPASPLAAPLTAQSFRAAAAEDDSEPFLSVVRAEDTDSDGIPALLARDFHQVLPSGLNWEGFLRAQDFDEQDVFGGYALAFEGFGYSAGVDQSLNMDGRLSLEKESMRFVLNANLLSIVRHEAQIDESSMVFDVALVPDDMGRPEFGGRVEGLSGSVELRRGSERVVMALSSQNLRYSRACFGNEKFTSGSWSVHSNGQTITREFSSDCVGRWR